MTSPLAFFFISFLAANSVKSAALVSQPYPSSITQPVSCLFQEVDSSTNKVKPKGIQVKVPVQKLSNGSVRCYWNISEYPEFSKKFAVRAINGSIVSNPTLVYVSRFWSSGVYLHYTQPPVWSIQ